MRVIQKLLLAFASTVVFSSAPAFAQATRTWVSGVGDDVNPCSRTAPCKTFAGAISKTATGGEINCLDNGAYGAVTITKSIVIDCSETLAGTLHSSTNGIVINAPGGEVVLRNLDINGAPAISPGLNGVRILQAASVLIDNCFIHNSNATLPNGWGVNLFNTGATRLTVTNSVIANNGTGTTGGGILIMSAPGGSARVALRNVNLFDNAGENLRVDTTNNGGVGGLVVAAENVFITGGNNGVLIENPAGSSGILMTLANSNVNNNTAFGLRLNGGNARMLVTNSTITGNGTGVSIAGGGFINTYGNNRLNSNLVADGAFSLPVVPQQ
ncbi:MAG: right-handed parallel beta-helix repeat-containing protein [Sphingomonadales bacterium]|nr:MAG: right-handed parallel beta-helix repeat-containing protein [Sphingomonadales bacterium]